MRVVPDADVGTSVFESHVAVLRDKSLGGEVERLVRSGHRPAEAALATATDAIARLGNSRSAYARERAAACATAEEVEALLGAVPGARP